jgi:hypothetical protein
MLRIAILFAIAFGSIWTIFVNPSQVHPDIINADAVDRKVVERKESAYGVYAWSRSSISENLWASGYNQCGAYSRPSLLESSKYYSIPGAKLEGPGVIPQGAPIHMFLLGLLGKSPALEAPRILIIGLGSGAGIGTIITHYPKSSTDIVEIDPLVIDISRRNFPLLRLLESSNNLRLHHADGRSFVRSSKDQSYDLIILDAFSGGSLPGHLLTTEYLVDCKRLLKPSGRIHMNLITSIEGKGALLPQAMGTLVSAGLHPAAFKMFYPFVSVSNRVRMNVAIVATKVGEEISQDEWNRLRNYTLFPALPEGEWAQRFCAGFKDGLFSTPLYPVSDSCKGKIITIDPVVITRETWRRTLMDSIPVHPGKPFTDAMPNADLFSH